jgi:hypothetical protein
MIDIVAAAVRMPIPDREKVNKEERNPDFGSRSYRV